jgi:putative oxidoreductase
MTVTRLLARPMLASMFVAGGVNSLRNAEDLAPAAATLAEKVAPAVHKAAPQVPLPSDPKGWVRLNGAVQVGAGLALATGRAPRLSAALLAGTLVPTTVAGHRFWEESDEGTKTNQKIHFFKNVSMLGGLLIAAVDTDGKPGVAWRARRVARDARREAGHLTGSAHRQAKAVRREARLATAKVA